MEALMRLSIFSKIEISLLLATILATSAPLVNAQNPDLNIVANPSSGCINIGSTATYQITLSSIDAFSGQVILGANIQPTFDNGPTLSHTQTHITISSNQSATLNLYTETTRSAPNELH